MGGRDKQHQTLDKSLNKTSNTAVYNLRLTNIKSKVGIYHEDRVYKTLIKQPGIFILKHNLFTKSATSYLARHDLTTISFADVITILKTGDWTDLYRALCHVNWFTFKTKPHSRQPRHYCCLNCRQFLFELGLFFHAIYVRCFHFVNTAKSQYTFYLTADNIDLNGILDFEDYIAKPSSSTNVEIMAPYFHAFYTFYEHVGCYFISSPIYSTKPHFDINLSDYRQVLKPMFDIHENLENLDTSSVLRPDFLNFTSYLNFTDYFGMAPITDIYNFYSDLKIDYPYADGKFHQNLYVHIYPMHPSYSDIRDLNQDSLSGLDIYLKTNYHYLPTLIKKLQRLLARENVIYLYVPDHPLVNSYQRKMQDLTCHYWMHHLYDANVNLQHFTMAHFTNTKYANFPIIGRVPNSTLASCKHPNCLPIPNEIKQLYDFGTISKAMLVARNIKLPNDAKNPLAHFDHALFKFADLPSGSPYEHLPNLDSPLYVNKELLDFAAKEGLNCKWPGESLGQTDNLESTYFTDYKFKQPSIPGIQDDLELFNLHCSGSIPPVNLLFIVDALTLILRQRVMNSDGKLNLPSFTSTVPIRNKHKSAGVPYAKTLGDSETVRQLYGNFRDAVTFHKQHSCDQALTLVINKIALGVKERDRTILAINVNKSESGRRLYRPILEKIKTSAKQGGPILIGFSPQRHGWSRFFQQQDENFNITKYVKRGGKDYPKWDRKVSNLLQFVTSLVFMNLYDPLLLKFVYDQDPDSLYHEFLAETTQIIYDYLFFNNSIYIKPGGVTSGNSRTADGNSLLHMLMDLNALYVQLLSSTSSNFDLNRDIRDLYATLAFNTPAYYRQVPTFAAQNHLPYISQNIARGLYLSDDGLLLFDERLIDYDDFMAESLLVATYEMPQNKDKYHVDLPQVGAREFLSQETVIIDGFYYPLPNFYRIYAACCYDVSPNSINPNIEPSRLFALYTLLYPYLKLPGYEKEKRFIQMLYKYIQGKSDRVDVTLAASFGFLDLDIGFEALQVTDINQTVEALYGFNDLTNPIDFNRYSLVQAEAITKHECSICGRPSVFICVHCHLPYCNSGDLDSHFILHINKTNHERYLNGLNRRPLKCKLCFQTNVKQLYYTTDAIYCNSHKVSSAKPIILNDLCSLYSLRTSYSESKHLKYLLAAYNSTLTHQHQGQGFQDCIKLAFELISHGYVRPFYHLIIRLASIEDRDLRNSEFIVRPVHSKSVYNPINNIYKVTFTFTADVKYDQHSTYIAIKSSSLNKNDIYTITNIYIQFLGAENGINAQWSFDCPFIPEYLQQIPLNLYTSALSNVSYYISPNLEQFLKFDTTPSHSCCLPIRDDGSSLAQLYSNFNKYRYNLIQGPPGCGKTYHASFLIRDIYNYQPNARVLVMASSHKAVDVLCSAVLERFSNTKHLSIARVVNTKLVSDIAKDLSVPRVNAALKQRLVFSTIQSYRSCKGSYDVIIFDEFSQIPDFNILVTLQHFMTGDLSVVAFGDHKQLSVVDELRTHMPACYRNIFNHTATLASKNDYPNFILLKNHFRSNPEICKVVADYSYGGQLVCKTNTSELYSSTLSSIRNTSIHVFPVASCVNGGKTGVYYNMDEIDLFLTLYNRYFIYDVGKIVILCTYQSQLAFIKTKLQASNICVPVFTIDSAQGDQYDHVFLCLTKTTVFALDPNRLNVAISRAKSTVYVTLPKYTQNMESSLPSFLKDEKYIVDQSLFNFVTPEHSLINPINVRELPDDILIRLDPDNISPVIDDYIYFDTEFLNTRKQTVFQYAPILISYSVRNRLSCNYITGNPVYFKDSDTFIEHLIPFDYLRENVQLKFSHKPELGEQRRQLLNITKQAISQGKVCTLKYALLFALRNCVTKPIFVVWAGATDLAFLQTICVRIPNALCYLCSKYNRDTPASFLNSTKQTLCTYHAQFQIDFVTHFVNLEYVDMKYTTRDGLVTGFSYPLVFETKVSKPAHSLSDIHSVVCASNHGLAHDPSVDTFMTRCIFETFYFGYLTTLNLTKQFTFYPYRSRLYNNRISELRRSYLNAIMPHLIEDLSDVCELGGGYAPFILDHNVDLRTGLCEDMNSHSCSRGSNLFIDSIYYYEETLNKPSYIFYDNEPTHYLPLTSEYCVYLYSKTVYVHKLPVLYRGENLFDRSFCACGHTTNKVAVTFNNLPCNIPIDSATYQICDSHLKYLNLFQMARTLQAFGFSFLYVTPVMTESALVTAPASFDHRKLQIPGYTTRGRTSSPANSRQKAVQVLNRFFKHLRLSLCCSKLPNNLNVIFFGAAGFGGILPMDSIFKEVFPQHMYRRVDPNLANSDDLNFFKCTIAQFPNYKSIVIISDCYNNKQSWFFELISYCKRNLQLGGHVIFKITSSFDHFDSLHDFASSFSFATVERLSVASLSSELWVFLLGYSDKKFDYNLKQLIYNHWYSLQRGFHLITSYEPPHYLMMKPEWAVSSY